MSALAYICRVFEKKNKEVAEAIGVTPQTLNDWIKQKRKIPFNRLEQLEEIFNLDKAVILKQEDELSELERLKIKLAYFKSINEFIYDPSINEYPFWSHQIEIRKLNIMIENKELLQEVERLIQGGGFIEDENYSIESVKNYQLLEGLVHVLQMKDETKIKQLQNILKKKLI